MYSVYYLVLMKLSDLSEFCHFKGIDEISAWRAFRGVLCAKKYCPWILG